MRYRSLIVFRLGGWSPLLPTGFLVSRGTLVPSGYLHLRLRGCHALWLRFPSIFGSAIVTCRRPATPGVRRPLVWPSPSSLATTKGIEFSFFSSWYLDVSLPRVPPVKLWIHLTVTEHYLRRVPPFGYPRFNACLRLPVAFRSLPRPSSAISARASSLCSYSLDLFWLPHVPSGFPSGPRFHPCSLSCLLRASLPKFFPFGLPFSALPLAMCFAFSSLCSFQGTISGRRLKTT